jgi:hypothetical protein
MADRRFLPLLLFSFEFGETKVRRTEDSIHLHSIPRIIVCGVLWPKLTRKNGSASQGIHPSVVNLQSGAQRTYYAMVSL